VTEVDFSVMATSIEFYTTMLGFVNFRLYQTVGLHYPPKLQTYDPSGAVASADNEESRERVYSLAQPIQKVGGADIDDQAAVDEFPPEEGAASNSEKMRQEAESLARLRTLFASCPFSSIARCPRSR